jgi:FixJ family two-component response regulator
VDDDLAVREGLTELILSIGLNPICFASTQELLVSGKLDQPGCLILDVRMPGASGLDLQRHLALGGQRKPIIFLTGHGDIPMTVQAMKAGAIDFLTKPVRDQVLLDAIARAIERDLADRAAARGARQRAERFETLTLRERQVFREVAKGQLNKQIAFELGIAEVTVKIHRGNVMRKMQARSIADLIRIWERMSIKNRND